MSSLITHINSVIEPPFLFKLGQSKQNDNEIFEYLLKKESISDAISYSQLVEGTMSDDNDKSFE